MSSQRAKSRSMAANTAAAACSIPPRVPSQHTTPNADDAPGAVRPPPPRSGAQPIGAYLAKAGSQLLHAIRGDEVSVFHEHMRYTVRQVVTVSFAGAAALGLGPAGAGIAAGGSLPAPVPAVADYQ